MILYFVLPWAHSGNLGGARRTGYRGSHRSLPRKTLGGPFHNPPLATSCRRGSPSHSVPHCPRSTSHQSEPNCGGNYRLPPHSQPGTSTRTSSGCTTDYLLRVPDSCHPLCCVLRSRSVPAPEATVKPVTSILAFSGGISRTSHGVLSFYPVYTRCADFQTKSHMPPPDPGSSAPGLPFSRSRLRIRLLLSPTTSIRWETSTPWSCRPLAGATTVLGERGFGLPWAHSQVTIRMTSSVYELRLEELGDPARALRPSGASRCFGLRLGPTTENRKRYVPWLFSSWSTTPPIHFVQSTRNA